MLAELKCVVCTMVEPVEVLEVATVFGQTGLCCPECIEYGELRQTMAQDELDVAPWWEDEWPDEKLDSKKNGVGAKPTYKYVAPLCRHHLTPYEVAEGVTIYLTGSRDLKEDPQGPMPTAGVYLDQSWNRGQVWANDGSVTDHGDQIPSLFVNWPDFGAVSNRSLATVTAWVVNKVKAGERVEIGCYGGHGRTGTLAAALGVTYGLSAVEAVARVRKSYCDHAVESKAQEELLVEWEKFVVELKEVDDGQGADRKDGGGGGGSEGDGPV